MNRVEIGLFLAVAVAVLIVAIYVIANYAPK